MSKLTSKEISKIEKIRERKNRTRDKVLSILKNITEDNPDIFQRRPEDRLKTSKSIQRKMKDYPKCTVNNCEKYINDIAGTRLVCCNIDEIEKCVDLIKNHHDIKEYKILRDFFKLGADDYGYCAHHLLVTVEISYNNKTIQDTCEVQIRTLAQDLWAILSRRDFYTPTNIKPPENIQRDMVILSKLLAVVDDTAKSIKDRIREETDRKVNENKRKVPISELLTPQNIFRLIKKEIKKNISTNLIYNLIEYLMTNNIYTISKYRQLLHKKDNINFINEIFKEYDIIPEIQDYIFGVVFIYKEGLNRARKRLKEIANDRLASNGQKLVSDDKNVSFKLNLNKKKK